MTQSTKITIQADKLGTFQWYTDSLEYLKFFGISQADAVKLDEARDAIQSILDKFEGVQ